MMLSALNATDGGIIDVTTLTDDNIAQLNGKRVARLNGYDVICKGCQRPAHLVRNHHKTVFFRHDPGSGSCILNELMHRCGGESEEHIIAKCTLIKALRSLGSWDAQPEQLHEYNGDAVTVDVEAIYEETPSHEFQGSFAWEVQMSHQTAGEFQYRTQNIRQITGYTPLWLTPHVNAVGDTVAMICDPKAEFIVDRLLTSYEPEIASPPLPVDRVVKSVHRKTPGHRWHATADGSYKVTDINAFNNRFTVSRPKPATQAKSDDHIDTGCRRSDQWKPIEIPMPFAGAGSHTCGACGSTIDGNPWGFTFDPPLHQHCFQQRQNLYNRSA